MSGQQLTLPASWSKGWGHLGKPVQPGEEPALRWAMENAPSRTGERACVRQPWATPQGEEALASSQTTQVYWNKATHLQTGAGRSLCVVKISALELLGGERGVFDFRQITQLLSSKGGDDTCPMKFL